MEWILQCAREGRRRLSSVEQAVGATPVRATQLDASLLDRELEDIFMSSVLKAVRTNSSNTNTTSHARESRHRYRTEWWLRHILRAVIWKLSFWDHNATHGLVLQNLKYARVDKHTGAITAPSRRQKALHGVITLLVRLAYENVSESVGRDNWAMSDSVRRASLAMLKRFRGLSGLRIG